MRVLAAAVLAASVNGHPGGDTLAVTIDAHRLAHSCTVASTATIVAFDAGTARVVSYRFVRSDGSVSRVGRLALAGDGAVAQSVSDRWTPRDAAPWVAFEIVTPERIRSAHAPVTPRCSHALAAVR